MSGGEERASVGTVKGTRAEVAPTSHLSLSRTSLTLGGFSFLPGRAAALCRFAAALCRSCCRLLPESSGIGSGGASGSGRLARSFHTGGDAVGATSTR